MRAALLELYASVGADVEAPQHVSRRFGINKTLAWNVSKIMTASDPLTSIPNLPGAAAFATLLNAIERHGASPAALQHARVAVEFLNDTVARHVGDRATLELIIDGSAPDRDEHLAVSRKLAFRGTSGLLGIQAKTRLMSVFMAPNRENPDRIDIAIVRGLAGLRRLRSDVRWPIFQLRGWSHDQDLASDDRWQPLEPQHARGARTPLLSNFSSIGADDLEVKQVAGGTNVLLTPGPVGNMGAVDCFVADMATAIASKYRSELDTTGEFGATISAPTERLIFDMVVHEDLAFALECEVRAFMGIFDDPSEEQIPEDRLPIPVPQSVHRLPGRPPVLATPSIPRYQELMRFVAGRMQWDLEHFRASRLDLSHPPFGSTILLRFKLPAEPKRSL